MDSNPYIDAYTVSRQVDAPSEVNEDRPFFSLKLSYQGDTLVYAALDGREMAL